MTIQTLKTVATAIAKADGSKDLDGEKMRLLGIAHGGGKRMLKRGQITKEAVKKAFPGATWLSDQLWKLARVTEKSVQLAHNFYLQDGNSKPSPKPDEKVLEDTRTHNRWCAGEG